MTECIYLIHKEIEKKLLSVVANALRDLINQMDFVINNRSFQISLIIPTNFHSFETWMLETLEENPSSQVVC